MAFVVGIPGALREFSHGRSDVEIASNAPTVGAALTLLWAECPGLRDRVLTERNEVRPHVNIFVDGENIRHGGGFDMPVREDAEIIIVPAVSGGASQAPISVAAQW